MSSLDFTKYKVGDFISFSGTVFTARDRAHEFILNASDSELQKLGLDLQNAIIYHCGPIVKKSNSAKYAVVSAGPTTSTRMNKHTPELIERFSIRAVIGKGGMDREVADAMRANSCVYLQAVGGAAALIAKSVTSVRNVFKLDEFGMAEAIWRFEVKEFPAIVAIDAHGNSIYEKVFRESKQKLNKLL